MRVALLPVVLAACAAAPAVDPMAWFAAAGMRVFAFAHYGADGDGGLVLVGGQPAQVGCVALFAANGEHIAMRHLSDDLVCAVAVGADGFCAAVGTARGEVMTLALPGLEPTRRWRHAKAAVAVQLSPDGRWLASGGYEGLVFVGALDGGTPHALEHTAAVLWVAWSADGSQVLAGARDGSVRLHERGGRLVRAWHRLGGEVVAGGFRDGRPYATVRASAIANPAECPLEWP